MEKTPLVSILLLSMNHELYIEQCIISIINQTYKNIEILYLDNASSDNTFSIGEKILKDSGLFFKTFSNTQSKNISTNFNFLFNQSSGSYISPMSADDWFEPENFEVKIRYFLTDPHLGALFSNGWIYYEFEKTLVLNDASNFKKGHIHKDILMQPDCIFYVGILYKRETIEKVGKWDETLIIEDTDMLIRISLVSTIDYIKRPLVYYRRLNSSLSRNKQFMIMGYGQYFTKYKEVQWVNMRKWLGERYRSMAAGDIDEGSFKHSITNLRYAISLNPLGVSNIRTIFYLFKKAIKK